MRCGLPGLLGGCGARRGRGLKALCKRGLLVSFCEHNHFLLLGFPRIVFSEDKNYMMVE